MMFIGIVLVYSNPSRTRLPSSDRKYPNYDNVTYVYTRDSDCCKVHFEDVGLESCPVKRETFAFCLSCQTNSTGQNCSSLYVGSFWS